MKSIMRIILVIFLLIGNAYSIVGNKILEKNWLNDIHDILLVLTDENIFSAPEFTKMMMDAKQLIDPITGLAYETHGGNILPYYIKTSQECDGCESRETGEDDEKVVLFIGGIHADEVSPLYSSFLLVNRIIHDKFQTNAKIIFAPLTNPDGILNRQSLKITRLPKPVENYCYRSNYKGRMIRRSSVGKRKLTKGVDPNRSFYTSLDIKDPKKGKKRAPLETRFVTDLIKKYKPDVIVSIHGPFGTLDYDGPINMNEIKTRKEQEIKDWISKASIGGGLKEDNDYPVLRNSLGAYGVRNNIHIITVELPNKCGADARSDYEKHAETFKELLMVPL